MKKKSARMGTLRKLALWQEREAAKVAATLQNQLAVEREQLQNLQHYYQDYLNTIDQQKSLARAELINYRNFCSQLAQTISQGTTRIAKLQQELEEKKQLWTLRHNKRLVLEELMLQCEKQESHWLEGELQKEIDDVWQVQFALRTKEQRRQNLDQ